MNFSIIKTGLVAVAAMVSLSSFSQDLIARQAPIDKKLKSVKKSVKSDKKDEKIIEKDGLDVLWKKV